MMIAVKSGSLLVKKQYDLQSVLGKNFGEVLGKPPHTPKKTGAHRLPLLLNPPTGLHVRDNRVAKLATFQQFSAFHQTFEVIGHGLGGDSAFHAFDDQVCGFEPLHVAQQYLRHKDLSY